MSRLEETLVLLKPDAIERGHCGEILRRFECTGLRIRDIRQVRLTRGRLDRHYAELAAKHPQAFDRTVGYLRGRVAIAIRLAGVNAVAKTRALLGPTDPVAAPAGTIRGDLGLDSIAAADAASRATLNLAHASDSRAAARRELRLWLA